MSPSCSLETDPHLCSISDADPVAHLCNNFGWYMLLVELPLFARTGLGADMQLITLMASLPFLANWLWSLAYSRALDTLRAQGHLTTLNARQGEFEGGKNCFWQ